MGSCGVQYVRHVANTMEMVSLAVLTKVRSQDCRAVKEIVEETFDKEDAPSALVIYVGQKPE